MRPYRADVVGSMLRPDYLLAAKKKQRGGTISHRELKQVEDRAVDEYVAMQERCGVDVLTDGEMRRNLFSSQLVQATEGFERVSGISVDWFSLEGEVVSGPVSIAVVSKLRFGWLPRWCLYPHAPSSPEKGTTCPVRCFP